MRKAIRDMEFSPPLFNGSTRIRCGKNAALLAGFIIAVSPCFLGKLCTAVFNALN
jgi:hypothetical protein